jgi:cysteine synthase
VNEEERRSHFATVRVELEDVTAEEAGQFWRALAEHEIEIGGYAAAIVAVAPEVVTVRAPGTSTSTIFPPDSEEESRRYHGD